MEPGSEILLITKTEKIKGTLMPSPKNTLIIKLSSGYNIGVPKKNIKKITIIKKPKKQKFSLKLKQNKNLPQISIILTGGTISSRISYKTGGVSWLTKPQQLLSLVPELRKIVNIKQIKTPFMIASENMHSYHWKQIAKITYDLLKSNEGVIITHGTDTLHFTASALSFMIKNLNKPVVLTYSQRSTDRGSTDATLNLICSAYIAKSDIAEVVLVGHGEPSDTYCLVNPGTKTRKMSTSRRDTFRPINTLPIAKIWPDGKLKIISQYNKRNQGKPKLDNKFEEKVALIKYYPGLNPDIIDFFTKKKYRGIVIETTGLGHIATDESKLNLIPSIKKAIDSGITICAASQTLYGRLNPLVYSEGRKLLKLGIIYLKDILPETAYIKLGYVLAKTKDQEKIKELMLSNLANEFNKRIPITSFLY